MSYTEGDAYERIAEALEEGHCDCYHIRDIVIGMTEKELSHPQISAHLKKKLERRLRILNKTGRKGK